MVDILNRLATKHTPRASRETRCHHTILSIKATLNGQPKNEIIFLDKVSILKEKKITKAQGHTLERKAKEDRPS